MKGEPIEAVNEGLSVLLASLKQNPFALESVFLSLFTFDAKVTEVLPLTSVDGLDMPRVATPDSGPTHLGAALQELERAIARNSKKSGVNARSDWAPLLFIMTDGRPSDTQLYTDLVPRIRNHGFRQIIGCAAGPKADLDSLSGLCDQIVSLSNMDISGFSNLFEWVSNVIARDNQSSSVYNKSALPAPPKEIQLEL